MNKLLGMLLIVPLLNGCVVELLPAKRVDDGYRSLTDAERRTLKQGECGIKSEKVGVRPAASNESTEITGQNKQLIDFSERSASDIQMEIGHHFSTWVMVLASWCPHAQKDLLLLSKSRALLESHGIHPIIVYSNYDLRYVSRKFKEYDLHLPVGIISAEVYGTFEETKIKRFVEELAGIQGATAGVPQHFLFDRKGKLLKQSVGEIKDLRCFFDDIVGNQPEYHEADPGR